MKNPGENSSDVKKLSVRRLAYTSAAVALAAAGSMLKIPSPVGSVALDSWPGYLWALVAGPDGVLVALAGHLVSALVTGLPLGLVLHAVVGVEMAICALAFRWVTHRMGVAMGAAAAVILNGIAAPMALALWLGRPLVLSLILPLSTASGINVALAGLLYKLVGPRFFEAPGSDLWRRAHGKGG